MSTDKISFARHTQSAYDALVAAGTDLPTRMYYITDKGVFYLNRRCYGNSMELVDDFPVSGEQGKTYVKITTLEAKVYTGSAWARIAPAISTVLSESSTDQEIPSALAVRNAINSAVSPLTGAFVIVGALSAGTEATPTNLSAKVQSVKSRAPVLGDVVIDTGDVEWYYDGDGWNEVGSRSIALASADSAGIVRIGTGTITQKSASIAVSGLTTHSAANGTYTQVNGVWTQQGVSPACTLEYDSDAALWSLVDSSDSTIVSGAGTSADDPSGTLTASDSSESASALLTAAHYDSAKAATEAGVMNAVETAVSQISGSLGTFSAEDAGEFLNLSAGGTVQASGMTAGGTTFASTPGGSTLATEAGAAAYVNAALSFQD